MKKILLPAAFAIISAMTAVAREAVPFNDNWSFCKYSSPGEVSHVTLPHCYNAEDATDPGYYRGKGVYAKYFDAPAMRKGDRVFVRFEAAAMKADVKVNGKELGRHVGGFNAFIFEITDLLKPKGNLIEVTVDNSKDNTIAPLEGDFTMFGGIYRPVSLLVLPKGNITPLDCASPGVYFSRLRADEERGEAEVKVLVDGFSDKELGKLTLRTTLTDAAGNDIYSNVSHNMMQHNGFNAFVDTVAVDEPLLWDGRNAPNLYTLTAKLMKGKEVVDEVTQTVGFRTVNIDYDNGLALNGRSHNIRGVNRQQDRPGKGWAISEADHIEDMEMIKEIGANGIRLAHYPHSGFFYDLCDKEGMLVWAEIPLVGKAPDDEEFRRNTELQLTELIRQNYNHPSIFCWSIFNELGSDTNPEIVERLNDLAHAEDATRYTVAASNQDNTPINDVTDIMGYNTYPGWYWADPATMQYAIDWKHHPGKQPLAVSEYGAGASVSHHGFLTEHPQTDGQYHPEEWQASCHEINYREIDKRDFVWGTFVWNMFDFASAWRTEGERHGMNDKGLVTYDRTTPKDAFYFYKANWNPEPMVHIAAKRFNPRNGSQQLKVYSNCDDPYIIHNGRKYLPDGNPQPHVYIWDNIKWVEGPNRITAHATAPDGSTVYDSCVIEYCPN
ncbi:MAG: glycoside hydrolase family 2 [Bacteroides sp.]|nr:glycoside hydrolase family 2 [Bacteroides sp.]